jgi:hypothetical protein
MSARHFVVGIVLWAGLLFLGARWSARPILWAGMTTMCCNPITVERAQNEFTIHLAAVPEATSENRSAVVNHEDGEADADDPAATDWAVRETRNRALVVFVLWMACGFVIHWVMSRIVRGEVDLS